MINVFWLLIARFNSSCFSLGLILLQEVLPFQLISLCLIEILLEYFCLLQTTLEKRLNKDSLSYQVIC